MRIDQWLCNARFFRARGLAQTAVDSGRVKVNGERAKSSVTLAVGDKLDIQLGEYTWELTVLSVTEYVHGFTPEPRELYEEDEDSLARRAQAMEAKKLTATERPHAPEARGERHRSGRGERPGGERSGRGPGGERSGRGAGGSGGGGNAPPGGRKGRHRRKRPRGGSDRGGGGGGGQPQ
jgi:ribosome-associated heat shock protein Hsp15